MKFSRGWLARLGAPILAAVVLVALLAALGPAGERPAGAAVASTQNLLPSVGATGVTYLCGPNAAYGCTPGYTGDNVPASMWSAYGCDNASGCPDTPHNCYLWIAYRLNQEGIVPTWTADASDWDTNAAATGVPVDQTPAVGSVAQWNLAPKGHVAWVESLGADGSITLTMDWWGSAATTPSTPGGYTAWIKIDSGSPAWPDNFLHYEQVAVTAAFTKSPASPTPAQAVQFHDTSTGGPTSWAWDFDNNGTTDSTAQHPSHTYAVAGTYTAKLTAGNSISSDSVTHSITVTSAVVPPGPAWRYQALNGAGSGVSTDHFGNGNALLQYGIQLQAFYADTTLGSLTHSWWDGTKWKVEHLDGNGGANGRTGNTVGANVAATQYGSTLQLFYADATSNALRHAWYDGAWHFETLDGNGGSGGRTANDVAGGDIAVRTYLGQLQVFYSDDTAHTLRHAWWTGTTWGFETLDTGLASSAHVAATQYGSTLQVMYAGTGGLLRHAWYDGAWHRETLDGAGGSNGRTNDDVGAHAAVLQYGTQLDTLYQDTTSGSLRHAWWNGVKWSFETLDGAGGVIPGHTNHDVGAYIAALPYGGGLQIVYQDTTSGALRHAWYAGGWKVEILDGTGATKPGASSSADTGRSTAILQYGTQLQLTYFDADNSDRFAHSWYS